MPDHHRPELVPIAERLQVDLADFQARVNDWAVSVPDFAGLELADLAAELAKEVDGVRVALQPSDEPKYRGDLTAPATAAAALGDILILLCRLAARLDIDLATMAEHTFQSAQGKGLSGFWGAVSAPWYPHQRLTVEKVLCDAEDGEHGSHDGFSSGADGSGMGE